MTIDTKRLKTDAAYWDEVAPDGATQYDQDASLFCCEKGYWVGERSTHYMNGQPPNVSGRFIPRPTKPAAPEWDGEGQFPPLGTRFRVALGRGEDDLTELVVTAVGRHRLLAVDLNDDEREWVLGKDGEFHTVRTDEQRKRDELEAIIHDCTYDPKDIADAILSRYNLEPKP